MASKEKYVMSSLSEDDVKLLSKIKKTVSETTDVLVKRSKDGQLNVYENKIRKVS